MGNFEQTLIDLEHEGWEALCTENGGSYYRDRPAGDALMAFPCGVMERDAAIEAMQSAPPWSSFKIDSPRVLRLTDNSGVVIYEVAAKRAGQCTSRT